MELRSVVLLVHLLGAIVWVGGMFFAYFCLRPAVANLESPALRFQLWLGVLQRFFGFVAASVVLILASGFYLMFAVAQAPRPLAWHLMLSIGCGMTLIFLQLLLGPYRRLRAAVAAQRWGDSAVALAGVRVRVATNLVLGLLTVMIAVLGTRFLG